MGRWMDLSVAHMLHEYNVNLFWSHHKIDTCIRTHSVYTLINCWLSASSKTILMIYTRFSRPPIWTHPNNNNRGKKHQPLAKYGAAELISRCYAKKVTNNEVSWPLNVFSTRVALCWCIVFVLDERLFFIRCLLPAPTYLLIFFLARFCATFLIICQLYGM